MAFIRSRNIKRDENGKITSGTAVILESRYKKDTTGKGHSKQVIVERLGKVVELYEGGKSGLFQSPTRGLVKYDSVTNKFSDPLTKDEAAEAASAPEIKEAVFPEPCVHTVFGDSYLLLESMKKTGIMDILKKAFPERVFCERLLCHTLHGILKDGSKITCDDFIGKSFASYCAEDVPSASLKSDTAFFSAMGKDGSRMAFFKQYVSAMRIKHPGFGKACIVDSTPLPNDINSPFNALCSHGVASTSNQMRLVLVLDEATSYPVWFNIIPGNLVDVSTLDYVKNDVEASLGIEIEAYYLDAGYATKEFIQGFALQKKGGAIPEKRYLVRMPARSGYPHGELYRKYKKWFLNPKYAFFRGDHQYFGISKSIRLFDTDAMAYIYRDEINAARTFREAVQKDPKKYDKMCNRDKEWLMHKGGFFILLSNYRMTPADMLEEYFARTSIETVFKTDKEYLKMLPLRKWSDDTVRGKILSDIINSIVRKSLYDSAKGKGVTWGMTSLIGKCQSLMCCRNTNTNTVHVETANKQVRQYYKDCGIDVPHELNLTKYIELLYAKQDDGSKSNQDKDSK